MTFLSWCKMGLLTTQIVQKFKFPKPLNCRICRAVCPLLMNFGTVMHIRPPNLTYTYIFFKVLAAAAIYKLQKLLKYSQELHNDTFHIFSSKPANINTKSCSLTVTIKNSNYH